MKILHPQKHLISYGYDNPSELKWPRVGAWRSKISVGVKIDICTIS